MKCTTPEISWHNRDPVLSVDIQPPPPPPTTTIISTSNLQNDKNQFRRLASGGTDAHVLIWYIIENESTGSVHLELATDLTRHQRAVNVVRWSPDGELLASGDDESVIFIWKKRNDNETINILENTNDQDKEIWLTYKILRGHLEDVYDLSWSPDSLHLISGSVDNKAILWDIKKGKYSGILTDHKGFVQGVSWDPQNKYVITLSTDRCFRIFDIKSKRVLHRNNKCILPVPENSPYYGKTTRLIHDDTLQTFYRRLSFSPDGELMIIPSGMIEIDGTTNNIINSTYIYTRDSRKQPVAVLPSPDQYTVAVRFCPIFFQLRTDDKMNKMTKPMTSLPYRMIFAIATASSVYLYDTQQTVPIGIISNIHYTRLTDLTWSHDGKILIVSSTDGFCTLILFDENELGTIYRNDNNDTNDNNNVNKNAVIASDAKDKEEHKENNNDHQSNNQQIKFSDSTIITSSISATIITTNSDAISMLNTTTTTTAMPPLPPPPPSISIIEKRLEIPETIISSTEKFESPEKKFKPATPIQIRREPRSASKTPINQLLQTNSSSTIKQMQNINDSLSPSQSASSLNPNNNNDIMKTPSSTATTSMSKPKSEQKINRIAVRRQPRNILSAVAVESPLNNIKTLNAHDDALDAWPIDEPKPFIRPVDGQTNIIIENTTIQINKEATTSLSPEFSDDFQLKYEDESQIDEKLNNIGVFVADPSHNTQLHSQQNVSMTTTETRTLAATATTETTTMAAATTTTTNNSANSTPKTPKTPRRVEFRTISTPKSKKKLI